MGSIEAGKLSVVIEGTAAPYKKAIAEAKAETKKVTDEINREVEKVKSPLEGMNVNSSMAKIRELQSKIKSAVSEYRQKAGFPEQGLGNALKEELFQKNRDIQVNAGIKEYTEEYRQAQAGAERAAQAVEKLKKKQQDLQAAGVSRQSKEWEKLSNQISTAERMVESYRGTMGRLEGTGKDTQMANQGKLSSGSYLQAAGAVSKEVLTGIPDMLRMIKEQTAEVIQSIPIIGRVATESAYVGSKAFGGLRSVFEKVTPAIKKAGGAAASLIQRFVSGIPLLNKFTGGVKQSNNAFGGGVFKILKYTLGIRSLYALVNKLRSALVSGFQNLAQYSDETNASLSLLMSSLTQLKNSLATAFAPILNVIAPALNALIQKINQVASAVAALMAALTGKTVYTRAKKIQQDYATSLSSNASGAKKANEENKKLQKTLLGFDQINKLDDNSNTEDSSAGESGGISPANMFEEAPVNSLIKDFAEKIKEAWKNADFTEIGRIVGRKLNEALGNIPWSSIQNTCNRIAKSIATFLNGFIEETDWNLVGSTIAQGLNTAIGMAYTFVTTFNWKQFGQAIADGINGFADTFDAAQLAQMISEYVKGILDVFIEAVENTDWKQVGEKIREFLVNIDYAGIADRLSEGFGAALGAVFQFVWGIIEESWNGIINWWHENAYEDGKFTIEGLLNGIWDVLVNIFQWIIDHILTPFIDGLGKAFGINGFSVVMAEQGKLIMDGFLKGIDDNVQSVIDWFKDFPNKITEAMGDLWELGKNAISAFVDGLLSVDIPTPHFEQDGNVEIAGIETPIPKMKVNWYASGGFPQTGEMFVARERGPELVGRMGGRNSVANNVQIIEGIKQGVIDAMMQVYMSTQAGGSNDERILYIEVKTENDEVLARAVQRGNAKLDRRMSPSDK